MISSTTKVDRRHFRYLGIHIAVRFLLCKQLELQRLKRENVSALFFGQPPPSPPLHTQPSSPPLLPSPPPLPFPPPPLSFYTASDQQLDSGKAWERDYVPQYCIQDANRVIPSNLTHIRTLLELLSS